MNRGLPIMTPTKGLPSGSVALLPEIRELNFSFLVLTRKFLISGQEDALASLGISRVMADALEAMSDRELTYLANTNLLLCRLHFDDRVLAALLSKSRLEWRAVGAAADPVEDTRAVVL